MEKTAKTVHPPVEELAEKCISSGKDVYKTAVTESPLENAIQSEHRIPRLNGVSGRSSGSTAYNTHSELITERKADASLVYGQKENSISVLPLQSSPCHSTPTAPHLPLLQGQAQAFPGNQLNKQGLYLLLCTVLPCSAVLCWLFLSISFLSPPLFSV